METKGKEKLMADYCKGRQVLKEQLGQEVVLSLVLSGVARMSLFSIGHYFAKCNSPRQWMMISVEKSVELLARVNRSTRSNLPQCSFHHHKLHMTLPGLELGPLSCKASG
jgi:hypothetical protein